MLTRRTLLAGASGTAALSTRLFAQDTSPIRIGASVSLSGKFSDSAVFIRDGYQLYVDETNQAGGIGGRKLELTVYDDASSPDTGRVLAERLINRDNVAVVLGPYSSPITDSMAVACERAEVPMIASIASDAGIWERRSLKWTFQAFLPSTYDQESFLAVARAKGVKRLALVFEDTPFAVAAKNWAVAEGQGAGITVDAYGVPLGATDFRSVIERIAASGADVISQEGYQQSGVALARQIIERGLKPAALFLLQASESASRDALGSNIIGCYGRSSWEASIKTDMNQGFVHAYEKRFGHVPSYHAATAFAAAQVVGAGLAQTQDKQALRTFFATQPVRTVMGTYKVNEKGIQTGYHYVGVQWQQEGLRIVWPEGLRQAEPIWPMPKWG